MRAFYVTIILLVAGVGSVWADILANGDFADGSAHWDGDRTTNTDTTALTITLKPNTWTKIYQVFHSADSALKLHVTYALSPGCTFLPQNGMASFFVSSGTIKDVTGVMLANTNPVQIPIGGYIGVIVDTSKPLVFTSILSGTVTTDYQNSEGFFYDLNPHAEKTFYLAFPPGNGTVTLSHVSLESAPQGPTRDSASSN